MYCSHCGQQVNGGAEFCANCGRRVKDDTALNLEETRKITRFLLTFFLGFIGSIIINHTSLRPAGWKSRTYSHLFIGLITFGIYNLVASIANFKFDPKKDSNIGYFRTEGEMIISDTSVESK